MRVMASERRPSRVSRVASAMVAIRSPSIGVLLIWGGGNQATSGAGAIGQSGDAGCQGGPHRRAGPEGAEDLDRGDGRQRKFRRDVLGEGRQAEHADVHHLTGIADLLQLSAGVVL